MNEVFKAYRSGLSDWKKVTIVEIPIFILYLLSIILIYGIKLVLYLVGYFFNIAPDILLFGFIYRYTESYPTSIFTILLTNKIIDFVLKEAEIKNGKNVEMLKLISVLILLLLAPKSI